MNVQKAIFPAVVVGALMVVGLIRLVIRPNLQVRASSPGVVASSEADQSQAADGGNSSCSLASSYPTDVSRWCDWIEQNANQFGIDPNLVAALILQESGGNPQAYSRSGAAGLMQVMPRDGIAAGFDCVNGPCFSSRPRTDELLDPQFNIQFGVKMLAGLIQKTGDIREALRAYGPMDVGYSYADLVLSIYQNYR